MLHESITREIIGAFYDVYNALGYGFLEKVYENALVIRLKRAGFPIVQQAPIKVYFDEQCIGEYYADLLVNNLVILELKTVEKLQPIHEAQLINYLKATQVEVGILFNFGPKPELKRRILTNDRKNQNKKSV